jgi:excisionase family DNA binding protein
MSVFGIEYGYVEAAEHVGLSVLAFKKLHQEGNGPVYRLRGRTVLFNVDELTKWAENYKRQVYAESSLKTGSKANGKPKAKANGKARPAATADLLA